MTSPSRRTSGGELRGVVTSLGGRMPMTPPLSTDNIHAVAENGSHLFQPDFEGRAIDQDEVGDGSMKVANNHKETPTADPASFSGGSNTTQLSENVQDQPQKEASGNMNNFAESNAVDYFAPQFAPTSQDMSPSLANSAESRESSNPASPGNQSYAWENFSSRQQGIPSNPGNPRPTSVPNFQSRPDTRRRDGPEYPNYPDQSFSALQDQQHLPPRQLRTRSSHHSPASSSQGDPQTSSTELPRIPSGAKSLGNTPAQSPGLFSPIFPGNRQASRNTHESRANTPMLHPTHYKPPKETHKLMKDIDPISGRKTINHYEIFEKLGSGQHGTVKQGRDLNGGALVAIKIVRRFSKKLRLGRTGDPNDMVKREVAILKKARHPHVVSLIEVIDDDEFGKVYLVLEYVDRGEIIWRKQTDKDICAFEMARSRREVAGHVDERMERRAVMDFNNMAPARRLEKAHLLAKKQFIARSRSATNSHRAAEQSGSDFWSLEFQGVESETGFETQTKIEPRLEDGAQTAEKSPFDLSPSHTPKPPAWALASGSAPPSLPSSRPHTPGRLEGTMYGPYDDGTWPDINMHTTLDEIITGYINWTAEEEDFRYVPCLTLTQCNDAFRDTVLGLEYLHYQGIIHRDIKPANLLWTTDYRVKISDFGVSYLGKPIREDDKNEEMSEADFDEAIELAKTVGTPAFYAPELCDPQYFEIGKHPDRPAITGQIDVWALGVTLYGMVFGRLPFFDHNEFKMYERIAREEVFIPRKRLKGVEHTDKTPSNYNKRLEDIVEYEDVDDELYDLLKRLLHKEPSKRITLKEVKHHPWVLRGISDQLSWMEETDPSLQSEGRKIEVSTQEVQDAVVGLTVLDRVKAGFQRVGSVLRGRGSRKRGDSNPKNAELKPVEPPPPPPPPSPPPPPPPPSAPILPPGRSRVEPKEQIYSALRNSRGHTDHPLAQSEGVSPDLRSDFSYFDEVKPARPVSDPQACRPIFPDRTLSTADSMKTVRAPAPRPVREVPPSNASSTEDFSATTAVGESNPTSSSLGGIFGGAGRRFVNSVRSRERGTGGQSPLQSSRSSSVDRSVEDSHASPSLALSSAIASGHVDLPGALRIVAQRFPHLSNESTAEALEQAEEQNNRRRTLEFQGHGRRPTVAIAAEVACPPSPEDEIFLGHQRPASAADSTTGFQVSSSSDQIISGESTVHSRIPSVVSGASSLSAPMEETEDALHPEKSISPLTISSQNESLPSGQQMKETHGTAAVEDEAGYNGDSDSDDEGLAMA
ncbi:hypothetical protein ACLMJK_007207 [Lecanora helva]